MSAPTPIDGRTSFETAVLARLTRDIAERDTLFARSGAGYCNLMVEALWWAYNLGLRDMAVELQTELRQQLAED